MSQKVMKVNISPYLILINLWNTWWKEKIKKIVNQSDTSKYEGHWFRWKDKKNYKNRMNFLK